MRQFQRCVEALDRELGAEPSVETRQLYADLRVADPVGGQGVKVGRKDVLGSVTAQVKFQVLANNPQDGGTVYLHLYHFKNQFLP